MEALEVDSLLCDYLSKLYARSKDVMHTIKYNDPNTAQDICTLAPNVLQDCFRALVNFRRIVLQLQLAMRAKPQANSTTTNGSRSRPAFSTSPSVFVLAMKSLLTSSLEKSCQHPWLDAENFIAYLPFHLYEVGPFG